MTRLARAVDPLWALSIGAAATALIWVTAHLGDRGLWWDELFTVGLAAPTTPLGQSWDIIRHDVHPPLYYLGIGGWMTMLNSSSEWAARSFNLVGLAIEVVGCVWAARNRVSAPLALWIGLFFTSFGVLWYLQEARMYAFLICQGFMACIVVLVYEQARERPLTWGFVAFSVLTFLVLPFTHWFGGLFGGLVLLGLFVFAVIERRISYAALFLALGLALGAATLVWAWLNWESTLGLAGRYGGGGGLIPWAVRVSLTGTILFTFTHNPVLVIAAVAGAVSLLLARPLREVPLIILASAVAAVALIFIISLSTPMYQTRNFTWFVAPGTLLAAFGICHLMGLLRLAQHRLVLALAAILAINLVTAQLADATFPLERDQWREAGRRLQAQPGCVTARIPVVMQWLPRRRAGVGSEVVQGQRIYGYYGGHPHRFVPVYREDTQLPAAPGGDCPVLLWIGQMTEQDALARAAQLLGPRLADASVVRYQGQSLFILDRKGRQP